MCGDGSRHGLDDVLQIVEAVRDDRAAQDLEARDVNRDVVVHEEDGPGAAIARVGDVRDHAIDGKAVEIPPAHLDDRAEAAVERAPARGFDDVDGSAHHGVAGEHPAAAIRQTDVTVDPATRQAAADFSGSRSNAETTAPGSPRAAGLLRLRAATHGT